MRNFIPASERSPKQRNQKEYWTAGTDLRLSDRGVANKRVSSNMMTCTGKYKYCPKRAKSLAKKYRTGEKHDESGRGAYMSAYRCKSCGSWHIGHNNRKSS